MDSVERHPIVATGQKPLPGQMALVSGANSGIGKAVAIALAEAGAAVAINYVTGPDEAGAVSEQIAGGGGRAITLRRCQQWKSGRGDV
jgi:glucose 1-dehydrogenase